MNARLARKLLKFFGRNEQIRAASAEEFAQARPFAQVFPELAASIQRKRGKQAMPTKELVSLRLSREALAKFRALGPGWQTRINEAVVKAAEELREG